MVSEVRASGADKVTPKKETNILRKLKSNLNGRFLKYSRNSQPDSCPCSDSSHDGAKRCR